MKLKNIFSILALAALSTINYSLSTAFAQGALTPPVGIPAPVMKSLDQIEARTPITNRTSSFTITQPGSYYLTGNLTVSTGNAITIATNNVSLDLNGFTISSTATPASGVGILFHHARNSVEIQNGFIRGSVTNNLNYVFSGTGFAEGIGRDGDSPTSVHISRIQVHRVASGGIELSGYGTQVDHCTVSYCGSGITANEVSHSRVESCAHGISAQTVSDSYGFGYIGTGIYANVVHNSQGESNGNSGIYSDSAHNCYAWSSSGNFFALRATTVNNCTALGTGGRAIQATVANGCYSTVGTNLITYKYNMP